MKRMMLALLLFAGLAVGQIATIQNPSPGSTLNTVGYFTWNSVGAPNYALFVSENQSFTAPAIFYAAVGNVTSQVIQGIPTRGLPLYVCLWTGFSDGTWNNPACYTYLELGAPITAAMQSPAPGSLLAGSSASFSWSNAGAPNYALFVSENQSFTAPAIFYAAVGNVLSRTVTGIPINSAPLYVCLWTGKADGTWQNPNCYSYTEGVNLQTTITQSVVVLPPEPDDYQPMLATKKQIHLSRGATVEVPRGDQVNIGDLRYTFKKDGDMWKYGYAFDNSGVAMFVLGNQEDPYFEESRHSEPSGWIGGLGAWSAGKGPAYGPDSAYSTTTAKLPGLVPAFFQSDVAGLTAYMNGGKGPVGLPFTGRSADDSKIANAASIYTNSVRKFVIGPVFDPGVSKDDVMARVQIWVEDYGFSFLSPLQNGGSIADLKPGTQLEQDIVDCLAAVLQ